MCPQRSHVRKRIMGLNTGNDFSLERNYGSASIPSRAGSEGDTIRTRERVRAKRGEAEVDGYIVLHTELLGVVTRNR